MRWVKHVCVDQSEVFLDIVQPFFMTFLDVLLPEVLSFEQLGAFGDFAAELGFIFLLDIFLQFFVESFINWLATDLLEVCVLGFKDLKDFFFIGANPIKGSLELLLCLVEPSSAILNW